MTERESTNLTVSDMVGDRISHNDSIQLLAKQLALEEELDSDTFEALKKFTNVEYLARSIKKDFSKQDKEYVIYPIQATDEEDNVFETYLYISEDNSEEYVKVLSRVAFGIYDKDLKTAEARVAARKIQEFIEGILG